MDVILPKVLVTLLSRNSLISKHSKDISCMRLNKFLAIQGLPRLALAFVFLQMPFLFPIWVLFLLDRGLSFTEIIIADMIFYGSIMA